MNKRNTVEALLTSRSRDNLREAEALGLGLTIQRDLYEVGAPIQNGDAAASGSRNTETSKAHPGQSLTDVARGDGGTGRLAGWCSPSANEDAAGQPGSKMQVMLGNQVFLADGWTIESSRAETGSRGALHPAFPCWLQGYPAAWDDCAASVTPSSRRSQRSSSAPTST